MIFMNIIKKFAILCKILYNSIIPNLKGSRKRSLMDKTLKSYKDFFVRVLHDCSNYTLQGKEGDAITRDIIARCNELGLNNLKEKELELYQAAVNWRTYALPEY